MDQVTGMKKGPHKPKQPYETPRIRKIKLTPDELASTGCKSIMVGPGVCSNGGVLVNRQSGS